MTSTILEYTDNILSELNSQHLQHSQQNIVNNNLQSGSNIFQHLIDFGYYQLFYIKIFNGEFDIDPYKYLPNILSKKEQALLNFNEESKKIINDLPNYKSVEIKMNWYSVYDSNTRDLYYGCFVNIQDFFDLETINNNLLKDGNEDTPGKYVGNNIQANNSTFYYTYYSNEYPYYYWNDDKKYRRHYLTPSLPYNYKINNIIPFYDIKIKFNIFIKGFIENIIETNDYFEAYNNRKMIEYIDKSIQMNEEFYKNWNPLDNYNEKVLLDEGVCKYYVKILPLNSIPSKDNYMYQYSREFYGSVINFTYPSSSVYEIDTLTINYKMVENCMKMLELLQNKIYNEINETKTNNELLMLENREVLPKKEDILPLLNYKNNYKLFVKSNKISDQKYLSNMHRVLHYPLVTDIITTLTRTQRNGGIETNILYNYIYYLVDDFCKNTKLNTLENQIFGLNEPLCSCTTYGLKKIGEQSKEIGELLENGNETCFIGKCKGSVGDNIFIENTPSEVSFRNPFVEKSDCPKICLQGITIKGDSSVADNIVQDCFSSQEAQLQSKYEQDKENINLQNNIINVKLPNKIKIPIIVLSFVLFIVIIVVIIIVIKNVNSKKFTKN